jgi:leucine-rich repeat and immunoglobulin-like domain-containing nogo receptor-interacting protein
MFHLKKFSIEEIFHAKKDLTIKFSFFFFSLPPYRAFVDNTFLKIITLDDNPSYTVLPMRLFHGNPNLIDISIRRNSLTTLDAAQFPLDRLQRLRLADNPFVCNCSLLWLWRLTTGHINDASLVDETETTMDSGQATSAAVVTNKLNNNNNNTTTILLLDKEEIGCDLYDNDRKIRKLLITMSESDIKCPAHMIRIISAILCGLLVFMTIASILYYIKSSKRKKKIVEERKNVNERIVPQKVDKLELERYLAAQQQIANEYHTLRSDMRPPWEMVPIKDDHHFKYVNDYRNDEDDHYEHFDYLDTNKRTLSKPHVVYV